MVKHRLVFRWLPLLLVATSVTALAKDPTATETTLERDYVLIRPTSEIASYKVVVVGPSGRYEYIFTGDETAILDTYAPSGEQLADGLYKYEITASPVAARARFSAEGGMGRADRAAMIETGVFTIHAGEIVLPLAEAGEATIERALGKGGSDQDDPARFFIGEDLIVDGSACIGVDCVNGESFGFDTIRLKENNLRIKFQDTSNSASFPTNDWQITANDSTNGGANKLSIDDIDGGRTPFTIEAGAPSHSLYVDSTGRLGVGKMNPVVELHVVDGDTPTMRLEQDGSSGFTPQTWDVAGNEANFFVRDVTNGSQLPFKIRPGADSNALFIDADNDIGIGTASPSQDLHLLRNDGTAQIYIQDTAATTPSTAAQVVIETGSRSVIRLVNNFSGNTWDMLSSTSGGWRVDDAGGLPEMEIEAGGRIRLGDDGNSYLTIEDETGATAGDVTISQDLTVSGNINGAAFPSDVNMKEEFEAIDPMMVLDTLVTLPVTTWKYRSEENIRHMGVMAQDFYAAFGLGRDDRSLSAIDPVGVNTAAIQGLNQKLGLEKDEIARLKQENAELKARLAKLEAVVQSLVDRD